MASRNTKPNSQYVWSLKGAADYLGISGATFWRMRHSPDLSPQEKRLISPRIIGSQAAFKKSDLDRFMSPELNAPGAKIHDPFHK